jgi:hypothetical protein
MTPTKILSEAQMAEMREHYFKDNVMVAHVAGEVVADGLSLLNSHEALRAERLWACTALGEALRECEALRTRLAEVERERDEITEEYKLVRDNHIAQLDENSTMREQLAKKQGDVAKDYWDAEERCEKLIEQLASEKAFSAENEEARLKMSLGVTELVQKLTIAREALEQITEGRGTFSTDHKQHAINTIESMKVIARAVVERIK